MLLSTFCLPVSLLASTFSAVLCIPQSVSNGIPNISPFDLALLPSPSFQDNSNNEASQNNELAGSLGADLGGATIDYQFGTASNDDNFDTDNAELLPANPPLLAQVQTETSPPSIPDTPTEIMAGERAKAAIQRADNVGRNPWFDREIRHERHAEGYDDSKCNGGMWACCKEISEGNFDCKWMKDFAIIDRQNCPIRACCFPDSGGKPNQWCPDRDPALVRALKKIGNDVEDAANDFFQKEASPAQAGGGTGAAVFGLGEGGGAGP